MVLYLTICILHVEGRMALKWAADGLSEDPIRKCRIVHRLCRWVPEGVDSETDTNGREFVIRPMTNFNWPLEEIDFVLELVYANIS